MEEVSNCLRMMDEVYGVFGLEYKMALSTRPEGYLGELELWDKAEASLETALNATGHEWEVCYTIQALIVKPKSSVIISDPF